MLARKQRRNLSSVVEWALLCAINNHNDGLVEKDGTNLLQLLWDVDVADRIKKMATNRPDLLTFEEEVYLKNRQ